MVYTNHHVALTHLYGLNSSCTQHACQYTVASRRCSTALQVTQNRNTYVKSRELLLYTFSIVHRTAFRTLRNDYDTRFLRLTDTALHEFSQLVLVSHLLRYDSCLSTASESCIHCQIARIASHHFHEEDALVTVRSIADSVHTFHDSVHRCVVADGCVCTIQVVIYRTRQTDYRDVKLHTEIAGTGQRTVTSDDYKSINLLTFASLVSLLHTLRSHEFHRTGSLQDSTSSVDDTADILCRQRLHFAIDESFVATIDTFDCEIIINTGTCHGTYSGIHARSVAARGQQSDSLYLSHSIEKVNVYTAK